MCVRKYFWSDYTSRDREEFCGIGKRFVYQSGGNLKRSLLISNFCIDKEFILSMHMKVLIGHYKKSKEISVAQIYFGGPPWGFQLLDRACTVAV